MIKINSLSKNFSNLSVVKDFNYEFSEQKVTCLYGPSGCGKTTLLNIISGLVDDYDGDHGFVNKNISYVFQEDRLLPWKTVLENIDFVLHDQKKSMAYLEIVKLEACMNKFPFELSGGMNRRVALARALAYEAPVLIMDEPFKGLDHVLKLSVIEAFQKKWKQLKTTVIIVTHDIEAAKIYSDVIVYLEGLPLKIIKVEKNERKTS